MIAERVPAALAGERLDRVVALLADVSRRRRPRRSPPAACAVDGEPVTVRQGPPRRGGARRGRPGGDPDDAAARRRRLGRLRRRVRRRRPRRRRQAGRPGRPSRRRQPGRHAGQRAARSLRRPRRRRRPATRPGIVHRLDAGSSGLLVVARTDGGGAERSSRSSPRTAPAAATTPSCGATPTRRTGSSTPRSAAIRPIRCAWRWSSTASRRAPSTRSSARFTAPSALARLDVPAADRAAPTRSASTWRPIGHPLVGDPTYGDRRPTLGLARPFLHAAELSFDHPRPGERLRVREPAARRPGDVPGALT